jgi:hypothetical protein
LDQSQISQLFTEAAGQLPIFAQRERQLQSSSARKIKLSESGQKTCGHYTRGKSSYSQVKKNLQDCSMTLGRIMFLFS